jgi:hypothetical protein
MEISQNAKYVLIAVSIAVIGYFLYKKYGQNKK